MSRLYVSLLTVAFVLVLPPRARAQSRPHAADGRAGIQAAQVRLDSVSRAGDARANADVFTEDAIVSMGSLQDIRGREALLKAMIAFNEKYALQAHQLQTIELEVYGDTAYDRGTYLFVSGPRGQTMKTERGRYAAMWLRGADGLWRIHRYLENLLPATSLP